MSTVEQFHYMWPWMTLKVIKFKIFWTSQYQGPQSRNVLYISFTKLFQKLEALRLSHTLIALKCFITFDIQGRSRSRAPIVYQWTPDPLVISGFFVYYCGIFLKCSYILLSVNQSFREVTATYYNQSLETANFKVLWLQIQPTSGHYSFSVAYARLTIWHPLLIYGYNYKASCARTG